MMALENTYKFHYLMEFLDIWSQAPEDMAR